MATKAPFKTTFEVDQVIQPIFTGGAVALDNETCILATTLGEDAILTDHATGKLLARVEGVGALGHGPCDKADNSISLGWGAHFDPDKYAVGEDPIARIVR